MIVRLRDVPELSPSSFQHENSIMASHVATPTRLDLTSGLIKVDAGWELVGWCSRMPEHLMYGRQGQIGLMLFHPDEGELWEHYPLYDKDDRDAAKFEVLTRKARP